MNKSFTSILLTSAVIVGLGGGCRIVSPVLLETPSSKTRSESIPLSLGVKAPEVAGSHRISDIMTYQAIGLMGMGARMPRRDETDYFNKALTDALRSQGSFQYIYATPFDTKDVDLVLQVKMRSCKLENSSFGTVVYHCQMIPTVGLFIGVGMLAGIIPQEHFSVHWSIDFELATRDGKVIKTYTHACKDNQFVNMWKQPFGNYMWYESLFLKNFNSAVGTLTQGLEKDRAEIVQAAGHGG